MVNVMDHRPIFVADGGFVQSRTASLLRSSIVFAIAILPKDRDAVLSTGEVIWVNTNVEARRSAPLPESLGEAVRMREAKGSARLARRRFRTGWYRLSRRLHFHWWGWDEHGAFAAHDRQRSQGKWP
jgi:hypothetical protein